MENAPAIILFWWFFIGLFVFMLVSLVAAIVHMKKGKELEKKKLKFLGKICSVLCIVCSVPIVLVIGYVLYLRFG